MGFCTQEFVFTSQRGAMLRAASPWWRPGRRIENGSLLLAPTRAVEGATSASVQSGWKKQKKKPSIEDMGRDFFVGFQHHADVVQWLEERHERKRRFSRGLHSDRPIRTNDACCERVRNPSRHKGLRSIRRAGPSIRTAERPAATRPIHGRKFSPGHRRRHPLPIVHGVISSTFRGRLHPDRLALFLVFQPKK